MAETSILLRRDKFQLIEVENDRTDKDNEMTQSGIAQTFERWHTEFRALLEEHRRDIQARLERIEKELDRKSTKILSS